MPLDQTALTKGMGLVKIGRLGEGLEIIHNEALRGNPELFAILGKILEEKETIPDHISRAIEYYNEGIERGDRAVSPVQLGRIYIFKRPDKNKAEKLFRIAENEGEYMANFGLGLTYSVLGKDSQDYKKAREFYFRSLKSGHLLSLGLIGESYQKDGQWLKGIFYRVLGAIVCFPIIVFNSNSRCVKML